MDTIVIRTNGKKEKISPKEGKHFSLKELQKVVGGNIELVYLDSRYIMIINDEGKINELPFNKAATEIFLSFVTTTDFIVGDAIVCERKQLD